MTLNEFNKLKALYQRCFTGKLKVTKRNGINSYPVTAINGNNITINTPAGFEIYRYTHLVFPKIAIVYLEEDAQSIADRINRNERV